MGRDGHYPDLHLDVAALHTLGCAAKPPPALTQARRRLAPCLSTASTLSTATGHYGHHGQTDSVRPGDDRGSGLSSGPRADPGTGPSTGTAYPDRRGQRGDGGEEVALPRLPRPLCPVRGPAGRTARRAPQGQPPRHRLPRHAPRWSYRRRRQGRRRAFRHLGHADPAAADRRTAGRCRGDRGALLRRHQAGHRRPCARLPRCGQSRAGVGPRG